MPRLTLRVLPGCGPWRRACWPFLLMPLTRRGVVAGLRPTPSVLLHNREGYSRLMLIWFAPCSCSGPALKRAETVVRPLHIFPARIKRDLLFLRRQRSSAAVEVRRQAVPLHPDNDHEQAELLPL